MASPGTALITGLTGFVGSYIARKLFISGWEVIGLKRHTSSTDLLGDLTKGICLYNVESFALSSIFKAHPKISAVVHVATNYGRGSGSNQVLTDQMKEPRPDSQVLKDNVLFPLSILEETLHREIPVFLNTDTCIPKWYPAMRPYALSKSQFAEWGQAMYQNAPTRFINVKICQPYGPGERRAMFIPWLLRQCLESQGGEILLSSGEQGRDFIHAKDVASAFHLILTSLLSFSPGFTSLDCGSSQLVTVREFVELVHRLTRSKAILKFGALPTRVGEISWVADTTLLTSLGWSPKISLEEGIRQTLRTEFKFE